MRPRVVADNDLSGVGLLEKIEIFVKVAELGSFSKAASALQMSTSTISRHIALIEAHFGVALLRRTTRTISLTEAGVMLRDQSRRLSAQLDELRAGIDSTRTQPTGVLTVEAPVSFGALHAAPAIFSFMRKYPDVHVVLRLNDAMVDLVGTGVDLAVRIGKLPNSGLIALKAAPQLRLACAAPAYLKRRGKPLTPGELASHDCLTTPGQPVNGWWRFGPEGTPVPTVRPALVCNNTSVLLDAAVAGLGIAHLPTWLVSPHLRDGSLIQLFGNELVFPEEAGIFLVRPHGQGPASVARFIGHFKEYIGNPPYWDVPRPRTE